MNYYEHHIGDYDSDTSHLSMLEDAAYSRLLRLYYRKETPIPADVAEACRLIRAHSKEERKAVETVLREFFVHHASGWHQKRCDEDIQRYQAKAARNREVGKLGGRPRKLETQPEPTKNPDGFQQEPKQNPLQTPDTINTSVANATGVPPTSAEEIFARGIPLLTAANVAERNARSMLGMLRKQHGDEAVVDALQRCATEAPIEPVSWLQAALKTSRAPPKRPESFRERDAQAAAQRVAEATGGLLSKPPTREVIDVTPRTLGRPPLHEADSHLRPILLAPVRGDSDG